MTKILVVEDEAILREELSEWLTFEGHDVESAEDGLAGLEAVSRDMPGLIISDITMPRLDGYGLLLEIRANVNTAHIPFILVTARASHDDMRQGMSLGADDYITKPFSRTELLAAVKARLDKAVAQEHRYEQQLEQLQNALKQEHEARILKAKLVSMFSHDFRNPITVVLSSNALLRDYADRLDEKRRLEHSNRIENAARLLLQMLEDMLLVAQMETENFDPEDEPLNLSQLLEDIVLEFQSTASEKHALQFDSSFHETVVADARLFRQIATNLISNAFKYSPQGGEVSVALSHHDRNIVLMVQDHGIGIAEADLIYIFDAFRRGNNVGGISGTGLGLAIVKQAVDVLGGTIAVNSQQGVGSTFTATIPYQAA